MKGAIGVRYRRALVPALAAPLLLAGAIGSVRAQADGPGFNTPGNILISDQFNNRVIEINPDTHKVVWSFGVGPNDISAASILGVNDAQRVGDDTLMAGTGVPAGLEPNCSSGCADNRVMLVDQSGHIDWQYGTFGVTGSGFNELNTPVQSTWLPSGHVLITDQANERIIEVDRGHHIVWQYGMTGVTGIGADQLNNPNSAELLENGHILIADENNNRVIEVTRGHNIVWQYPSTPDPSLLNGATFASRLANGDTLITDSNNNRVIEVTHSGAVVWTYVTNTSSKSNPNPLPTRAVRLADGDTLISDQFNDRVIEVTPSKHIEFTQGKLNIPGFGFNLLNAPYD
ncbi:MAG: hypothetical protein JO152_11480, partial [Mycobacteriaceae bacterium]|nr:hypothetical protein [Mycobacteriaceae bacterium]